MILTRRNFLIGLSAPAIVRATSLMPVRALANLTELPPGRYEIFATNFDALEMRVIGRIINPGLYYGKGIAFSIEKPSKVRWS